MGLSGLSIGNRPRPGEHTQECTINPRGATPSRAARSRGEPVASVAAAVRASRQTIYKWVRRDGKRDHEHQDRSSRPHYSPQRLARHRRRQIVRYERDRPGELVHRDIKKLGRIGRIGHRIHGDRRRRSRRLAWEHLHVAIDDHTRLAYSGVLADEIAATATAFLGRAVAWYAALGIPVERILTDNGGCYRAQTFAEHALELGISQRFTRPYRPQTNGKAERFIRTLLAEWAYAHASGRTQWRTAALVPYLTFYNTERRHSAVGGNSRASRLLRFV